MAEKKVKKEKIPRQPMPEQEPDVRRRNFKEVPLGYSKELAMKEAERCLQCKNPTCVSGCPVSIDIPAFIKLIKEGDLLSVLLFGYRKYRFHLKLVFSSLSSFLTTFQLFEQGYDAVYVGVGAGLPRFMNIPGENLIGIYSANEYLTRSNLMKAYLFPEYDTPIAKGKNVAVFGAGNVAMDSARTAMRLGADTVRIVYRRSREEMPARAAEIHHAGEEGIEFYLLTAPTKFIGDENGRITGMECLKMELGEPDESGRRRPVPIKGSEFQRPPKKASGPVEIL